MCVKPIACHSEKIKNLVETLDSRAGYPLKFRFQIPCVFSVRPQIFPVAIYVIYDYYIHKTDLADLSSFKQLFGNFHKY